jgi:hypothetical protein
VPRRLLATAAVLAAGTALAGLAMGTRLASAASPMARVQLPISIPLPKIPSATGRDTLFRYSYRVTVNVVVRPEARPAIAVVRPSRQNPDKDKLSDVMIPRTWLISEILWDVQDLSIRPNASQEKTDPLPPSQ